MPRVKQPGMVGLDPYLKPFAGDIHLRLERYNGTLKALLGKKGALEDFANGHHYFGIRRTAEGWVYREWAPGADKLSLLGDFNDWNPESHPLTRLEGGAWEIVLQGHDALRHGQHIMVRVTRAGVWRDRIPLYIRRTVQDKRTHAFDGQVWEPDIPYEWHDAGFSPSEGAPFIYEAHIGIAAEEGRIGTYREFADLRLNYIKEQGYTAVQLMAVMDHPYYASFGYQIGSFFAASSWFGEPEDLKYLVDRAHGLGLSVYLDVVHSHASKNMREGINAFDGTNAQFFHEGERGYHPAWDSKLFNYADHRVIHFLLSNIKFWMEEYHFDGFRVDGVTSMLYKNHGLGQAFVSYHHHYSLNTDIDACVYLMLLCELAHKLNPRAVLIAEDMSGMPGMALPITDGGFGFDYRLGMGIPDLWIQYMKLSVDEQWDMRKLWYELNTSRPGEKRIGYSESHDQALVGDKTLFFWLADADIYTKMDRASHSLRIDRAMALIKMIRLITASLAGDGYLNFMGNEFGHPEWIDFPREGNGWSYHYARRQWSLKDDGFLKYGLLLCFDKAMLELLKDGVLPGQGTDNLWIAQDDKIIAYRRGEYVFAFNFHPTASQERFFVPTWRQGVYSPALSTDEERFGGPAHVDMGIRYETLYRDDRGHGFYIYLPARCAVALKGQEV